MAEIFHRMAETWKMKGIKKEKPLQSMFCNGYKKNNEIVDFFTG